MRKKWIRQVRGAFGFPTYRFLPLSKAIRESVQEEIENERTTQGTKTTGRTRFTKKSETAIWLTTARFAQRKTAKSFTAKTTIGS